MEFIVKTKTLEGDVYSYAYSPVEAASLQEAEQVVPSVLDAIPGSQLVSVRPAWPKDCFVKKSGGYWLVHCPLSKTVIGTINAGSGFHAGKYRPSGQASHYDTLDEAADKLCGSDERNPLITGQPFVRQAPPSLAPSAPRKPGDPKTSIDL